MNRENNRKKKTLEDLWYLYQIENPIEKNSEERIILDTLNMNKEKLCASLNEEQTAMLESIENCLDNISGISSKEAFIKGIRFATGYLVEAMYK